MAINVSPRGDIKLILSTSVLCIYIAFCLFFCDTLKSPTNCYTYILEGCCSVGKKNFSVDKYCFSYIKIYGIFNGC